MSSYAHPESLVSTQWVADHLSDPTVRFVEAIWGDGEYRSGHIPGALAWDFATELQDPNRNDIIDQAGLEALLARSGVTPATTVVVYSGLSNLLATFAFWLLKVYGHRDVRLLDGDRSKWLVEGRPLSDEMPSVAATIYHAQPPDSRLRAHRDDVLQAISAPGHLPVDARPVDMYLGENSAGMQRGGHIPTAVSVPATAMTDADGNFQGWQTPTTRSDGVFKSLEELQALFVEKGVTSEKKIVTYCVRGGLSTHMWFVLTQLLGYPNVREYDRSWAEWGNLADAPIEK